MFVEMITTAAGPEWVLSAGKVYNLPRALAAKFLHLTRTTRVDGKDVIEPTPACRLAKAGAKVARVQSPPDPEDKLDDIDEDADILEEADE